MDIKHSPLSPKERLTLYAAGKEVDRIPVMITASETAPLLYGIPISDYYFSSEAMVLVETKLWEDFGADNMGMGLGLRTLVEALGTKLKYPRDSVSYIDVPFIQSYEQLEQLSFVDIHKDGRFPIILEAFKRLLENFGETHILSTGMAGPLTTAIGLIGTERFLKDSVRNKESIHRLLQFSTDCILKCAQDLNRLLELRISLSEPMASRNILSLKQFKELEKPYLSKLVREFSKFQSAPPIHICGFTADRWLDIADTGVGGFSVDNCEDLYHLKTVLGDKMPLIGNVPPVEILRHGTPDAVDLAAKACIEAAGNSPMGFTLSPGCTVPVYTAPENIRALIRAAETHGAYATKGKLPKGLTKNESMPPD